MVTAKRIAEYFNITPSYIHQMKRGRRNITRKMIEVLCHHHKGTDERYWRDGSFDTFYIGMNSIINEESKE